MISPSSSCSGQTQAAAPTILEEPAVERLPFYREYTERVATRVGTLPERTLFVQDHLEEGRR